MADKVTTMEMKVDLQCPRCYRKIKKVLCKFPEVRNQMYDEKQNKVTITVVTCCPDVIRKWISSEGGMSIENIEIITDKKKETEKKKEAGGDKDKPKDATADKKKESPKEAEEKKKDSPDEKPKPKPVTEKKSEPQVQKDLKPIWGFPTTYPNGLFYDNQPFYQGYGGVPMPMPSYGVPMPIPRYSGVPMPMPRYGVPAYEGYVGNRGGYNNTGRFDYFSEENPQACSIM